MRRLPPRFQVLLITLFPDAHASVLESFRNSGASVRIASTPGGALARLRRGPDLVLVDLALGAGLTPAVVAAINAGRGPSVVVALHDGAIEDSADATDLSVDGFCRASDLVPHARFATGAVFAANHALH
jgi:CheY-like chemotaxis protein